jgi:hypothetical protein
MLTLGCVSCGYKWVSSDGGDGEPETCLECGSGAIIPKLDYPDLLKLNSKVRCIDFPGILFRVLEYDTARDLYGIQHGNGFSFWSPREALLKLKKDL